MNAFTEFAQHMDWQGLLTFTLQVLAVLLCLTVHESCHGLAAYLLGDPTAKAQHRISMNPLRHIDPFGALMMLVAGFGWAKPVQVDPRYFKHPKRGMALTALAGPLSNFVLAYVALLLWAVAGAFSGAAQTANGQTVWYYISYFCSTTALMSIGLGIFNLIPFPPLDGSKIAERFLPDRIYVIVMRYERWGMLILMALLLTSILDAPLAAAQGWVLDLLLKGALWPYYLLQPIL